MRSAEEDLLFSTIDTTIDKNMRGYSWSGVVGFLPIWRQAYFPIMWDYLCRRSHSCLGISNEWLDKESWRAECKLLEHWPANQYMEAVQVVYFD